MQLTPALICTTPDGIGLDLPAIRARYAAHPDRAALLAALWRHVRTHVPDLLPSDQEQQVRLAANAVLLIGTVLGTVRPVRAFELRQARLEASEEGRP